jgi:hypothetical protein
VRIQGLGAFPIDINQRQKTTSRLLHGPIIVVIMVPPQVVIVPDHFMREIKNRGTCRCVWLPRYPATTSAAGFGEFGFTDSPRRIRGGHLSQEFARAQTAATLVALGGPGGGVLAVFRRSSGVSNWAPNNRQPRTAPSPRTGQGHPVWEYSAHSILPIQRTSRVAFRRGCRCTHFGSIWWALHLLPQC